MRHAIEFLRQTKCDLEQARDAIRASMPGGVTNPTGAVMEVLVSYNEAIEVLEAAEAKRIAKVQAEEAKAKASSSAASANGPVPASTAPKRGRPPKAKPSPDAGARVEGGPMHRTLPIPGVNGSGASAEN